jgi:hypothetical protein
MQTFKLSYRNYAQIENPPILHRKEQFVAKNHPLWKKFCRLTKQEVCHGLYENLESIGTRLGWQSILKEKGLRLAGHRVLAAARKARTRPLFESEGG